MQNSTTKDGKELKNAVRIRLSSYDYKIISISFTGVLLIVLIPWIGILNASSNFYLLSFSGLIMLVSYLYFFPLQYLIVKRTAGKEIDLELIHFNQLK